MSLSTTKNLFGVGPTNAVKRTSTSQNKFLMGIGYPLAKTRSKKVFGDIKGVSEVNYFAKAVDKELITGMLRQLFLTRKGERVMNPSFGLDLSQYVFSQMDITTFEIIRSDIMSQVRAFVPFLEIIRLQIFESDSSIAENGILIKMTCKIKDVNLISPFEIEVQVA